VSDLRNENVIAVLCADLHFRHTPPLCRATEPDWYAAMERAFEPIFLASRRHNVPIICAGDIFHRWNPPAQLINLVLELFSDLNILAIPGQHDLPLHNYKDMDRSAYGTLTITGAITNLSPHAPLQCGKAMYYGFPWGFEIKPPENRIDGFIHVAVCHSYIWTDAKYANAPEHEHARKYKKKLKGYDAAVFGDNHNGFLLDKPIPLLNCGTLTRQRSDEFHYKPAYGLLYESGAITRVFLDTDEDTISPEVSATSEATVDAGEFAKSLIALGVGSSDYAEAVRQYIKMERPPKPVRKMLLEAIGD